MYVEGRAEDWPPPRQEPGDPLAPLLGDPERAAGFTYVHRRAARAGDCEPWPAWADPLLVKQLAARGIPAPWRHQRVTADLAWGGRHVVISTGTASGKTLAYQLPALSALRADPTARVLYLAPTKALAGDQLRSLDTYDLPGLRTARYDGDTSPEERAWVRAHATFVLTNPDMLHRGILPRHAQFRALFRGMRYVVVDECHTYRGVFGSHVAQVLRRLRRVCAHYGAYPTFVLASATSADPAYSAGRLTGLTVEAVRDDHAPRGALTFALYEPQPAAAAALGSAVAGEPGPARRSATAEAGHLLAALVAGGTQTLAFVRSRPAAESVASAARRYLAHLDPVLGERVAAYRAGYLREERRALEADLRSGRLMGVASTNALELGIDLVGLDVVLLAGWPGTVASLWQQAGRSGRAGQPAHAIFIARDDPLDTYLVRHPEALFDRPVESTVLDPANPYVLGPHLTCAAVELPLTDADLDLFDGCRPVLADLVATGQLRRRGAGWFWARHGERPSVDLRGSGSPAVALVERTTGRLLGHVDGDAADRSVHDGAVYVHQGRSYVVHELDLEAAVALLDADEPPWTTIARSLSDVRLVETLQRLAPPPDPAIDFTDERFAVGGDVNVPGLAAAGAAREIDTEPQPPVEAGFAIVDVSTRVVSYLRRRVGSGEVLGEVALDLPARTLRTRAVYVTFDAALLAHAGLPPAEVPGAAHAAEHAAIGMLPLFATCDRWDVGGVSTAWHPDTGLATIFVYDGHAGGAGFAERGFARLRPWLTATRDTIATCRCAAGCPSCVYSPKCGNGNNPLSKRGAVLLLDAALQAGVGSLTRPADPVDARAGRPGAVRTDRHDGSAWGQAAS